MLVFGLYFVFCLNLQTYTGIWYFISFYNYIIFDKVFIIVFHSFYLFYFWIKIILIYWIAIIYQISVSRVKPYSMLPHSRNTVLFRRETFNFNIVQLNIAFGAVFKVASKVKFIFWHICGFCYYIQTTSRFTFLHVDVQLIQLYLHHVLSIECLPKKIWLYMTLILISFLCFNSPIFPF